MTLLRRASQLVGVAALGLVAVFLVLEMTDVVGSRWRRELADGFEEAAFPSWNLWLSGLVGAGLAIVGVMLVAAQIAPPKKGLNSMHEVYKGPDGDTRLRGRAAIRAARHELESIEGVVDVDTRLDGKSMRVEVEVDDRADLLAIEEEARTRLDHEFWINLGLADFAVDLFVTHHPNPPRVR